MPCVEKARKRGLDALMPERLNRGRSSQIESALLSEIDDVVFALRDFWVGFEDEGLEAASAKIAWHNSISNSHCLFSRSGMANEAGIVPANAMVDGKMFARMASVFHWGLLALQDVAPFP